MSDEIRPQPAPPPVIDYNNGRPPGQPRRWRLKPVWPVVLTGAIAGGGTLLVLLPSVNSCRGATRTTRLQWMERSAEIDQITESPSEVDR